MRVKKDYTENDQLLPAHNVQSGVADEYIAVLDVAHYLSSGKSFLNILHHIFDSAMQDFTEHINSMRANAFVPFESRNLCRADVIYLD